MRIMALRTLILLPCFALTACVEANTLEGREAPSLCTEDRDVNGIFCAPDEARLDSIEALALLRQRFPGSAIYVMRNSVGALNVDGQDTSWEFTLRSEAGEWLSAGVYAEGEVASEAIEHDCAGTPFEPLDSRRAVHEAIARIEERIERFTHELGSLHLSQDVCGYEGRPEAHYVRLGIASSSAGIEPGEYYARFRHDGSYIDFIGPCPPDLTECLAGVVLEPDE